MITINWCWLHTFRRLTGYPGYSIVLGFTQNVLLRKRKYQDWYTFLWIHGKFYSFSSIESIEIKLEIKMIFHDYLWISENFYDLGSFVAKFCLAGFPHFSAIFVGWKEVTAIECMVGLVMTISNHWYFNTKLSKVAKTGGLQTRRRGFLDSTRYLQTGT